MCNSGHTAGIRYFSFGGNNLAISTERKIAEHTNRSFNPDYNWQNNQNVIEIEDSNSIDTNLYLLEQLIFIQQDWFEYFSLLLSRTDSIAALTGLLWNNIYVCYWNILVYYSYVFVYIFEKWGYFGDFLWKSGTSILKPESLPNMCDVYKVIFWSVGFHCTSGEKQNIKIRNQVFLCGSY